MKKSIFKITTLLLLLCAAVCSVVGIAACSSSGDEESTTTADEPIVGTWVAACNNYNYMLGKDAFYYYLTVTTSGAQLTCAFKYDEYNGGTDYTILDRDTANLTVLDDSSEGDYQVSLRLSGGNSNLSYKCVITMTDNDTFTLVEYYAPSPNNTTTYTYTFTRTTMTLDEWKSNPTGSAS